MNNEKIFVPSFEFERKTKAFNRILWGFVALISMFAVGLFVFVFHLMMCSILNITSTIMQDNMSVLYVITVFIFAVIFGIGLFFFFYYLLHSYKFENNRIIKGKIIKGKKFDFNDNAIMSSKMVKNIGNPKNVVTVNTVSNLFNIMDLIKLNFNKDYVNKYFDTDVYKKKFYTNPILLKETKYFLIYICDNNKKLKIPKIYEGMNVSGCDQKQRSLINRIFTRSLLVFLIFSIVSIIDLFVGYMNNTKNISIIYNTYSNIEYNLKSYGYNSQKINEKCYEFRKRISNDRTSVLKYYFDKNGDIIDVEIEIFFNNLSNVDGELSYIIKTLNYEFTDYEINNFISKVNSCIKGICSYDKVKTLIIGTSEGLVQVHN